MDHREPDRMGTADTGRSRRFARLVPAEAVRRLALPRVIMAAVAALLGLALLGSGVWYLGSRAAGWVERHEDYSVPFKEIRLDPPPPPWYRGGAPAFLDHVKQAAMIKTDRVPILDGDLARLKRAFLNSPWVRSVVRVRSTYPRQLVVTLVYREPVAVALLADKPELLIDDEAVILPTENVDRDVLGPLVRVHYLDPPHEPRPGVAWQTYDEAKKRVREDQIAMAAARLSSFLRSPDAARVEGLPPPVDALLVSQQEVYIQFKPRTRFRWGKPPGSEAPDEPTAVEKWQIVRQWFRDHPGGIDPSDYLVLSKKKIEIRRQSAAPAAGPLSRSSGGSGEKVSR